MAEQAPQYPAEVVAELNEMAAEGFEYWRTNSTDAQRAVGQEELRKMTEDPAFMEQTMAEITKCFSDADANSDGLLDLEEYKNFMAAWQVLGKARGNFEDERPESIAKAYAAMNKITAGTEGITMGDFQGGMGVWMQKVNELKAAAGM